MPNISSGVSLETLLAMRLGISSGIISVLDFFPGALFKDHSFLEYQFCQIFFN